MKRIQTKTPEEFAKIKPLELYDLWFHQALTDKTIAIMYGVTKEDVKAKRKEFHYTHWSTAMLYVAGGEKYKKKKDTK